MHTLNAQQQAFAEAYVLGETAGNAAASAAAAGYTADFARQTGYRLLRHEGVRAEIDRLTRQALGDHAAASVAVLKKILSDERNDKDFTRLKLDAAKAILDRAGYVAPKAEEPRRDPNTKPVEDMTLAELDAFIAAGQAMMTQLRGAGAAPADRKAAA